MSEWQPIETAPKDGSLIDLYSIGLTNDVHQAYLFGRVTHCYWHAGRKRWEHKSPWGQICVVAEPQHWMPQPEPPLLSAHPAVEGDAVLDVDALAQEIRRVDGSHSLGAGALAEALAPFMRAALDAAWPGMVAVDGRVLVGYCHPHNLTYDGVHRPYGKEGDPLVRRMPHSDCIPVYALAQQGQADAVVTKSRWSDDDDGMERTSIKYTTDRKDGEPEGSAWWEWKRAQLDADGWIMESECDDCTEIYVRPTAALAQQANKEQQKDGP